MRNAPQPHNLPPIPPAFAGNSSSSSGHNKNHAHHHHHGKEDSSWITAPHRHRRREALEGTTRAFAGALRCSLDEAESRTTLTERIDSLHTGRLLQALEVLQHGMATAYGLDRLPRDLEHHLANARRLYEATPVEERDHLSAVLRDCHARQQPGSKLKPLVRAFSVTKALANNSPPSSPSSPTTSIDVSRLSFAGVPLRAASSPTTVVSPPKNASPLPPRSPKKTAAASPPVPTTPPAAPSEPSNDQDLPSLEGPARNQAQKSMFWLCYFVRYVYNVHRLVLQFGYDPVDAAPMAFLRYLHPYFGEYYYRDTRASGSGRSSKSTTSKSSSSSHPKSKNHARGLLGLLEAHQQEHFFYAEGAATTEDLRVLLGVLEVVLYLWTPAFQDMALEIDRMTP